MPSRPVNDNRLAGKRFEALVMHRAQVTGHLCIKNPLSYQNVGGGRQVRVPSELDFTLANGRGQVAFLDAKVINRKSIPHSLFIKHQVARAFTYNKTRVPSGFIVLFQKLGAVYFISGLQMHTTPVYESFPAEQGLLLGKETDFKLAGIFDCHSNFVTTF